MTFHQCCLKVTHRNHRNLNFQIFTSADWWYKYKWVRSPPMDENSNVEQLQLMLHWLSMPCLVDHITTRDCPNSLWDTRADSSKTTFFFLFFNQHSLEMILWALLSWPLISVFHVQFQPLENGKKIVIWIIDWLIWML